MIKTQMSSQVASLVSGREPFVLATVVLARRPTSVRPGDVAVVRRDGTIEGFVGGVCAESSVRLHSLRAMETGEPLLLRLVPGDVDDEPVTADGAVVEHNPCLSGGSLEIFLEPHLPATQLVVVGGSPIAHALDRLARAAGYDCRLTAADEAAAPDGAAVPDGAAAVVVASHGNGEETVLAQALSAGVPYVALVASPRRGAAVRGALDVPEELRAQLHTPAGMDIGARTPDEIAISILAQLVAQQHVDPAPGRPGVVTVPATPVATDPVCGMSVAVSPAAISVERDGETVYFCGPGCRDRYALGERR